MGTMRKIYALALIALSATAAAGQDQSPALDGERADPFNLGLAQSGRKNPWLAFAASAVLPGAGQFYGSRPLTGSIFVGLEVATLGTYFYLRSEGDSRESEFMRYAQTTAGSATTPPDQSRDFDKYHEDLIKEDTLWSGRYFGDAYVRVFEGSTEPVPYTGDAVGFFNWEPIPGDSPVNQEIAFNEYYEEFDQLVIQQIMSEEENESFNQKMWREAARSNLAPNRRFTGDLQDFFYDQQPLTSNSNLQGTYDEYRVRAYGGTWAWNWAYGAGANRFTRPVGSARTEAQANVNEYKRLRGRSNDAFKQATFVGGLAIFNHVIASIHAAKGAVLKNRESLAKLPGDAKLGLGVDPSLRNPKVELRLTRAF